MSCDKLLSYLTLNDQTFFLVTPRTTIFVIWSDANNHLNNNISFSGSENRDIYIWKTNHDYSKFSSVRRDRNDFWEAIKAHNATVTCAIFGPNPEVIIKMLEESQRKAIEVENCDKKVCTNLFRIHDHYFHNFHFQIEDPVVEQHTKGCGGYVLVSADFNGCIKVFVNKIKPKHSSLPVSAMA